MTQSIGDCGGAKRRKAQCVVTDVGGKGVWVAKELSVEIRCVKLIVGDTVS